MLQFKHMLVLGVVIAFIGIASMRTEAVYGHGCQAQGGCCTVGGCRDQALIQNPSLVVSVIAGSAGAMLF
ncbi:MAG: hypothetical protein ACREA4_00945, partial [Nitrososphaera sp.]